MKILIIILTFASILIISCQKDNNTQVIVIKTTDTIKTVDTIKIIPKSLINPPQKYWGDYYSKTSWGTYVLIANISKDDIVYLKESLSLKYKNFNLLESEGNQYVLTTTFSASPQLGDFHNYKIWTMNDSMIYFHAKLNGTSKWELIRK